MNNISIGQYIPKNSWIHKLDPRFKMLAVILMIVATFLIQIPSQVEWIKLGVLIGLTVFTVILIISAKIPIFKALAGLRSITFLIIFMTMIQFFTHKASGDAIAFITTNLHISLISIIVILSITIFYLMTKKFFRFRTIYFLLAFVLAMYLLTLPQLNIVSWHVADFVITDESLMRAIFLFLRMVNVILITSLLTYTTMPTDLNYGLEFVLYPLKLLFIPVEIIAMLFSLSLRNIPTFILEMERITKAQASRGADLKEGNLKEKVSRIVSLLIPIFIVSIKRADDMANTMEVRGYQVKGKRTRIDTLKLRAVDIIALIVALALLAGAITIRVLGL